MKQIRPFTAEQLQAIAKVLGDTHLGLTGSEIEHTLAKCRIPDVDSINTKWKRLYNAFAEEQNKRRYGNHVVAFIHKSMNPVLYSENPGFFDGRRVELNTTLAFAGFELGEDGKIRRSKPAKTISEAQSRADSLRAKLKGRDVHADVMLFCKAELLVNNYFHAVLEATKSVADKIRSLSGLSADGAELAQKAFSLGASGIPVLRINALATETQKSEQTGFVNLLVGLFGMFRNPTAHEARIYWPIDEQDALDILSLVSLVHRKLDKAKLA